MSPMQILSLLLALSTALNIAFAIGLLTRRSGIPQAILAGASAAATSMGIYLAAVAAYR
ncbi:hypothetical protein ABT404_10860 [Streptomyces hyaluromycini]|uniref:Uncharacterized protein n=1 Tax=Streptomyces hyaluromycini TaxID=1377993 RepID=A0ABV1WSY1_9ACTN